jgi:hypothetical protein
MTAAAANRDEPLRRVTEKANEAVTAANATRRAVQTDRPIRYFFYGLATGLLGAILYLIGGYVDSYATSEGVSGDGLTWDNILEQVGRIIMLAGPALFWLLAFIRLGKEPAGDTGDREFYR